MIWHFRKLLSARRNRNDTVKRPASPARLERAGRDTQGTALEPVDPESFNTEFLEIQQKWVAGEGTHYKKDELYSYNLKRGVSLARHDFAVVETIAKHFEPGSEILEVGSGHGALALLLAHHGFTVQGFEGDDRRFAAASWHFQQYRIRHPKVVERV